MGDWGRAWTDDEEAYLLEHGPEQTAHETGRTVKSCRSKMDRLLAKGYVPGRTGPLHDVRTESGTPEPPRIESITGVQAGERPDVDEIRRRHAKQYESVKRLEERKRQQHVYLDHAPAMIVFTSDQHIGGVGTDIDRMYAEQEMVMATPGAYVMLGGDIVDAYLVGRLIGQNMHHHVTVPEEWDIAADYMARWKDRIIAACGGNHDGWVQQLIGVDYTQRMTPAGVIYDRDEINVYIHAGAHTVKIRSRHKWSGGSQWNPTHALEKSIMLDDPSPDVVVGGHVHKGAVCRELHHNGKRKVAILTGTFKVHDSYQRQEGFTNHDSSTSAALIIMPDGSFMATASLSAACQVMRTLYSQVA